MAEAVTSRGERLTRGALAARTGCIENVIHNLAVVHRRIETIRYYERIGLMPDPPRTKGGHRAYDEDHLRRLAFICRARELGFSLGDVRGLLVLVDGGAYSCAEVKALTLAHVGDIRRKIGDLRKIERVLDTMAAQCDDGEVPQCPVIDSLFQGKQAPG